MGKAGKKGGKKSGADSKAAAKAAKKLKQESKQAKSDTKQIKKKKGKAADKEEEWGEDDFLQSLEAFRKQWAEEHKVTEDVVEGPPSRRANATFSASPVSDHLYLFGGEFYDGQRVEMYADLYRYDPTKNEWRRFTSPTQPSPRAAHAAAVTVAGGGRLWIHGGEYSAPNQNSFYHYHDLWSFSFDSNSWERWEVKSRPSARSGHRMAVYKNFIFLFGGFQDTGIRTTYLNDLWAWSLTDFKWHQVEFSQIDRKPPARSGFSFLPTADGLVLHGGYTKQYEGKRVTGVALNDTWVLKVPPIGEDGAVDFKKGFKWEKRKNPGMPPNPSRSGCTMTYWANKGMGVLFGGVSDDDKDEETLDSTFYNELFGYNTAGNGRWVSLLLRRRKKQGGTGGAKKKKAARAAAAAAAAAAEAAKRREAGEDVPEEGAGGEDAKMKVDDEHYATDDEVDSDDDGPKPWEIARARREMELAAAAAGVAPDASPAEMEAAGVQVDGIGGDDDVDDPDQTVPGPRYNTMLAVLRNTLYMYGGILEAGNKEYTLADFYSLNLDKMDKYKCLREDRIDSGEWAGSDSENDDDSDSDEDDEGSQSGRSDGEEGEEGEEDDGTAPIETEPMEVDLDELALTETELAAKKAEKARSEQADLTKRAQAFMGVSSDPARKAEDAMSTPSPGETLAQFFARSRDYWTAKAHGAGQASRGKELRRDGFALAEQRYEEYKPVLDEIVRLQEAAGAEAVAARASARAGLGADSRNRR
ncbi:Kel3p [Rhodotorula paludigena]|uniref:Kel3p n=1 Tax=Rhodotorula paludigena TaxID=86838 RepID=UPI0031787332